MDYKYIEEKLNQELIDSGLSKEEIMELRANSSFDILVKAEKPYMTKKPYDNELSYLQYDGKYYLLYVIKADIPETGKNAFIGGNIVVAIGKKPMEIDELSTYYDKDTITQEEFYAPFVFPSLLWRKGYVSTIGKYNSMFDNCCFYLSTIGKYDDYYGERVSVDENSVLGRSWVYTLSGVPIILAIAEYLWKRYNWILNTIYLKRYNS